MVVAVFCMIFFIIYRNEVDSLGKEVQLMKQRLQKIVSQRNTLRCCTLVNHNFSKNIYIHDNFLLPNFVFVKKDLNFYLDFFD